MTTASKFPDDVIEWTRIHIGDDAQKDYIGAINAGWYSLLIPRENLTSDIPKDTKQIESLHEVMTEIESIQKQ
jgi:FMN phosphatase YigB (HAD superfamily)